MICTAGLQLFEVFVESVGHQDLATSLLALHLLNHLPSSFFRLLSLHRLTTFFHLLKFLLVARLFCFLFLPDLVSNLGHDIVLVLELLFLFLFHLLLVMLQFLHVEVTLLPNDAVLQPLLEILVRLVFALDLLETFYLLLAKLIPFLQDSLNVLLFFPVVHVVRSVLV